MKRTFTLIAIMALFCINGYSQVLANTTWIVYDPSPAFAGYFRFQNDTVLVSSDNISYSGIANYHEIGNTITVYDFPGGTCPASDTGHYTFSIQNDSLNFVTVNEPCFSREQVVATFSWTRINTSIQESTSSGNFKVYPNPASNHISIQSAFNGKKLIYHITDQVGKVALTGYLNNETTVIDIAKLTPGFYFIKIGDADKVFKLLKQ